MKSLRDYITETEATAHTPRVGDDFAIEFGNDCLIESHVVDVMADGVVIAGDAQAIQMLEAQGCKMETIRRYGAVGSNRAMGYTLEEDPVEETRLSRMKELAGVSETAPYEPEQNAAHTDPLAAKAADLAQVGALEEDEVDEAKYQGREVQLNKPMAGDVKKSKVYVRDPATGNIKKVNFGHGGTSAKRAGQKPMHIKKSNPARRKSFRARHNCENPGPKTSARYWSCRAW